MNASPVALLPQPDETTRFFWDAANEHKLMILRCQACGFYVHWPRPICPQCQSFNLAPAEVSGRGTLYTYAVCVQAFHPWFESRLPYFLAVVELPEQKDLKLVTNIVECVEADVSIGMSLEVTFEQIAPAFTLPMFRPAGGPK